MSWPEVVCHLGARLAEALDYAHRQGVLHRDIKPANVLLGADAAPRLADFNVGCCSKLEGASPAAFFGGSIPYMSPEQIEAFNPAHAREVASLDGRADLYSLGVTLWELLTGRRPFPDERLEGDWGQTLAELTVRRMAGISADALAALPPDLLPGLRDVLLTCLDSDPAKRYATAGQFARELDLCRKPHTRELLCPPAGWRTWVRRYPLWALYPTGLITSAIASPLSIWYNGTEIVDKFPDARQMFELLQLVVNGSLYPLGILLFGLIAWPVVRGLRRLQQGPLPAHELARLRRHCLRLAPMVVVISVSAWAIAGVIFPVTIHLTVHPMPTKFHIHFLLSQTLFGLIASSFPLFAVHFVAIRALYPALLPSAELTQDDVTQLNRLDRSLGFCLVAVASIPLLAVGLLAISESNNYVALGLLSAAGIAGFAIAYMLAGAIRADKNALLELAPR